MTRILAALAAALLACAPAAAQNIAKTPAAATLTGAERITAAQGSGCATAAPPCAAVYVTPLQVATFLAPTFEVKDSDLDAIAALSTQPFGRSLLTQADASAARGTLGLGSIATQAASGVAITGGSITGIADVAVADGGTGASTAAVARANLGAAAAGANSDITSLAGLTTPLSAAQGGTGDVGGAWTAFAPTVGANSGSFGSALTVAGRYRRLGKTVTVRINVYIANNGSAAGFVTVSLPFAAVALGNAQFKQTLGGQETTATGFGLAGIIADGASSMNVVRYDGAYPGGSGYTITLTGSYEAA